MKKWEVTFTGDDWKLTVSLDYQEGDLFGLIEKAKEVAGAGECGIKVEGYYQVDEREIACECGCFCHLEGEVA